MDLMKIYLQVQKKGGILRHPFLYACFVMYVFDKELQKLLKAMTLSMGNMEFSDLFVFQIPSGTQK